jgi:hypothetical protein
VTSATDVVQGDVNGLPDLHLRDLVTGSVQGVSEIHGADYAGPLDLALSAEGRFPAYETGTVQHQVLVFDALAGTHELISGPPGTHSAAAALSGDGRFVAFASYATDLGGAAGSRNVFLRGLVLGTTRALNVDPAGSPVARAFARQALAAGGSAVAFRGNASSGAA